MDQPVDVSKEEKDGKDKKYDEYEINHACDTLVEAEMIKKNGKLMKLVQPKLDEKMGALKKITSIDELKDVAKQKSMEE
jgi:hypothetical protein